MLSPRTLVCLLFCAISTLLAASPLRLTEFSAGGRQGLIDEDGESPDWIEIQNISSQTVNLHHWTLTDDPSANARWSLPSTNLPPATFLIVFASGKDRAQPGATLHTDFKLNANTGSIILTSPTAEISAIDNYPPQIAGVSFGLATIEQSVLSTYLTNPTPGASNAAPISAGPRIHLVRRHPPHPRASDDPIQITAKTSRALADISTVTLRYRINFGREIALSMQDDGEHHDAAPHDGIFGVTIPPGAAKAGQMVRYSVTAQDTAGRISRWPLFANRAGYSAYEGTLIPEPIETRLPVYHLFTPSRAALTTTPSPAALFHAGELYDNVAFSPHGQISSSFPKPSFNLDFPHDHRFRFRPNAPRVSDLKILGNFADKSKIRNTLSYEMIAAAGSVGHFAFPVRLQHHGQFFCIAEAVEDGDDRWLARVGLDPQGALYKIYAPLPFTRSAEKKTRQHERAGDLTAFVAGLAEDRPLPERVAFALDHLNLPQCISYLVAMSLINSADHGHKNYYLYRDTRGSRQWSLLPWDVDLSWGRTWTKTYFDDQLYFDTPLSLYRAGAKDRGRNPIYNLIFEHPHFRQMYLRRLRTVVDEWMVPTGPQHRSRIEMRIHELLESIDPPGVENSDARLDTQRWPSWGVPRSARDEAQRIISDYLPARLDFLLNRAALYGDRLPPPQPPTVALAISRVQRGPASEQYLRIGNTNNFAVDISSWKLAGAGINFTFAPGTVLPAQGNLDVVGDLRRVRASDSYQRHKRLLQGNWLGTLAEKGEPNLVRP